MNKTLHLLKLGWAYRISRSTRLGYPPFQYTIEPTNVCNLRCPFCPQSDPEHPSRRRQGRLSVDDFTVILDRITLARPGNRNLNFTLDGEPYLNPDFNRFVALAASRGFTSVFATNATALDPETADRLIAAGPFLASIDFAAAREVFESIRGRPGDYEKVLANLRHLAARARDHAGVRLDIHDIASYTGADASEALTRLRALFPADLSPQVRFDSRVFHNFCGHLGTATDRQRYRLCPYPWTQMAIAHNGDVVACCRDTVGRSVLGNVLRDDIMTIWNGEPYRQFRRNLIDRRPDRNAACADCDLPWSAGSERWRVGYILKSLLGR